MKRQYIVVRGQYEGFHKYADAPLPVAFLQNEHRHLFKWKAQIEVLHDDRELEFFLTKHDIEIQLNYWLVCQKRRDLGSCEMQADKILEIITKRYGMKRRVIVSVSEDGESDGVTVWDPYS